MHLLDNNHTLLFQDKYTFSNVLGFRNISEKKNVHKLLLSNQSSTQGSVANSPERYSFGVRMASLTEEHTSTIKTETTESRSVYSTTKVPLSLTDPSAKSFKPMAEGHSSEITTKALTSIERETVYSTTEVPVPLTSPSAESFKPMAEGHSSEITTNALTSIERETVYSTMEVPVPLTSPPFERFRLLVEDCPCHAEECQYSRPIKDFSAIQGEVAGILTEMSNLTTFYCYFQVRVEFPHIVVKFDFLTETCAPGFSLAVRINWFDQVSTFDCSSHNSALFLPYGRELYFLLKYENPDHRNLTQFRIRFKGTEDNVRTRLEVTMVSSMSGYVTPPYFDGIRRFAPYMDAFHTIYIADKQSVMIKCNIIDTGQHDIYLHTVSLSNDTLEEVWRRNGKTDYFPVEIYNLSLQIHFKTVRDRYYATGFNISFTILPSVETPRRLASGRFDCSQPHRYARLRPYVQCNLRQECEGGEDEGAHCPFSSPACQGDVPANKRSCYTLMRRGGTDLTPNDMEWECQRRGADVAMTKTREEWNAFSVLIDSGEARRETVLLGLRGYDVSMPQYYRLTTRWLDNTVNYNLNTKAESLELYEFSEQYCGGYAPQVCFKYYPVLSESFERVSCVSPLKPKYRAWVFNTQVYACQWYFAESNTSVQKIEIKLPERETATAYFKHTHGSLVTCPSGHVTFQFLACLTKSECGVTKHEQECKYTSPVRPLHNDNNNNSNINNNDGNTRHTVDAVETFQCQTTKTVVPYSFVCDFWDDCEDGSDEFCEHSQVCEGFTCTSGQCVDIYFVCDTFLHCVDGSDEEAGLCYYKPIWNYPNFTAISPPAIINFDGSGFFTQTSMNRSDSCPETHFRCPGELDYCLPVYVVCNGVYDCLGHEDEADCGRYTTCPGLYRCWDSPVCLHPEHVCDGVFQCPRHDDELFCNMTCPPQCRCQGLAFVCHQPFSARDFPDLRYLDAIGSGMSPQDVSDHVYVVWLRMASCRLSRAPLMHFPNLRFLDLSENLLTMFSLDTVVAMHNLRNLSLAGNPLTKLYTSNSSAGLIDLQNLDISRTQLTTFDSLVFEAFWSLKSLNMSNSKLAQVSEKGFQSVPSLSHLDIRGNAIREYPADAFKALTKLAFLYTSDFRFCCRTFLPDHHDDVTCKSPQDEVSSCEDLLRSNVYRVFLWLICVMSVLGNAGSFLFRCVVQNKVTKTGFNVFVTNLCLADLLMGVYLAMVGVADALYRGQYLSYERTWTSSAVCKLAGFLSLLSSEVSAFIICLITLDRFIVLRFPFSTVKFRKLSASAAVVLVWTLGLLLAAAPLLPVTSQWEFYGQSGICIPLPITRKVFEGRDYSFGVMIVFNFILFLLIAVGQSVIYHSVQLNVLTTSTTTTTKKSQDLTIARRLLTVVVSDFACWFPIGVLGLLASAGVPIPGEVNVAVAIFVLPLNSALNPFLYTFNLMAEKRKKALEVKLMNLVEARVKAASDAEAGPSISRDKITITTDSTDTGLTFDEAFEFLRESLASKMMTVDRIKTSILSYSSLLEIRGDFKP